MLISGFHQEIYGDISLWQWCEESETKDKDDIYNHFDQLQSNKTDIVAQAMEISSIPTDMNNNFDIVSQAMELSDISSDTVMNFWFD